MKFKFLSILALGAVVLASCSDDDNAVNGLPGVTVNMANASIRVSEDQASSTSFNYIPVTVEGETNGPVKVTIELLPYGEHPATADVNYIVTSNTIIIPAGETTGRFQYYPVGDDIINDDRSFEVKITKVEGAEVGAQASTVVTLVDNEGLIPIYYDGLAGAWSAIKHSASDGNVYQANFTIDTVAEGEEGYGKTVKLNGFPEAASSAMSPNSTVASFSVDGVEQAIYLTVTMGQNVGTYTHGTYGLGQVMIYPASDTSYWSAGEFTFKFNFDLATGEMIPNEEGKFFGVLISFSAGMMMYDTYDVMQFVRN